MKSSIRPRVVKSYAVEVAAPRLVKTQDGFRKLEPHLTVISAPYPAQGSRSTKDGKNLSPEAYSPPMLDEQELKQNRGEDMVSTEVERMLAQAKVQAEEILSQAQAEAADIRQKALAEIEKLREETAAQVRSEVSPAAYNEGYQAGFAQGKAEAEKLKEDAGRILSLAKSALYTEYKKVDEQLLTLVLTIAEKLVRVSLEVDRTKLLHLIRSLTLIPQQREGMCLYLSPEDGAWYGSLSEQQRPPCAWQVDDTLNPGDCYLESADGLFDARFEAQLERLAKALRKELEHGGLAATGSKA